MKKIMTVQFGMLNVHLVTVEVFVIYVQRELTNMDILMVNVLLVRINLKVLFIQLKQ